jgi:hypothetical protein
MVSHHVGHVSHNQMCLQPAVPVYSQTCPTQEDHTRDMPFAGLQDPSQTHYCQVTSIKGTAYDMHHRHPAWLFTMILVNESLLASFLNSIQQAPSQIALSPYHHGTNATLVPSHF